MCKLQYICLSKSHVFVCYVLCYEKILLDVLLNARPLDFVSRWKIDKPMVSVEFGASASRQV